ncbi:MAG: ACT domain-containing protein [Deltaproteobacteria bacterium]|nr:ACT domain-containing protein [Deltaproteobacteria bacterium]
MRVERQLSLIIDNRPGVLAKVCGDLAQAKIDIRAINVENLVDHSAVRVIVDDPDKATHLLGAAGVLVFENEVLAISVDNKPGSLVALARRLGTARVNIDYMYGSTPDRGKATIYLRVNNPKRALDALKRTR